MYDPVPTTPSPDLLAAVVRLRTQARTRRSDVSPAAPEHRSAGSRVAVTALLATRATGLSMRGLAGGLALVALAAWVWGGPTSTAGEVAAAAPAVAAAPTTATVADPPRAPLALAAAAERTPARSEPSWSGPEATSLTPAESPSTPREAVLRADRCRQEHWLMDGPKIVVRYDVGADGRAVRVRTDADDPLSRCLAAAVRETVFGGHKTGQQVTL